MSYLDNDILVVEAVREVYTAGGSCVASSTTTSSTAARLAQHDRRASSGQAFHYAGPLTAGPDLT